MVVSQATVAEIHTGIGQDDGLLVAGWDFSDSTLSSNWDIFYAITKKQLTSISQFEIFFCYGNNNIMYSDSSYEDVTTAPEDSSLYSDYVWVLSGKTYILQTRESHYVKLRVIYNGQPVIFEYTYQDDGSRDLVGPVPIEKTTWGRIKALYE